MKIWTIQTKEKFNKNMKEGTILKLLDIHYDMDFDHDMVVFQIIGEPVEDNTPIRIEYA